MEWDGGHCWYLRPQRESLGTNRSRALSSVYMAGCYAHIWCECVTEQLVV